MRATRAIIHLNNLRHNITVIKKHVGGRARIYAVVKADAYGHGAIRVSRLLLDEGVSHLGVAYVSEAVELRESGISVLIYLFNLPIPEEIETILLNRAIPFIATKKLAQLFAQKAAKLGIMNY